MLLFNHSSTPVPTVSDAVLHIQGLYHVGVPQGTIVGPILWNALANNLRPDISHIKYTVDAAIYPPSLLLEISQSTAHSATIKVLHNSLQAAAAYYTTWCGPNCTIRSTPKSHLITFFSQKTRTSDPIRTVRQSSEKTLG